MYNICVVFISVCRCVWEWGGGAGFSTSEENSILTDIHQVVHD